MIFKKYTIADTSYAVNYSQQFTDPLDSIFLNDNDHEKQSPEIAIESTVDASIGGSYMPSPSGIVGLKRQDGYTVYMCNDKGNVAHLIQASADWRCISVLSSMPQLQPFEGSVGEVIFRTTILFNQGIVIHAAAIEYEGKGVVFSAPSGTGKSTQANLWVKHKGARILNGDRPCLRISKSSIDVYGTPWSGTSKLFLNQKAPLAAIIMLEQSKTNELCQLSAADALRMLVPRCYLPYYDENLMTLALENIGLIIKETPIYLLKCRPDLEAVELVAKCLKLNV